MIPFGPWRPDSSGINTKSCFVAENCLPTAHGFEPLPSLASSTSALPEACMGAVTVRLSDGSFVSYAGTATGLYRLDSGTAWVDVSRTSGGAYATPQGERWNFAEYGNRLIATNFIDDIQVIDLISGTNFEALGGNPPRARYVDVVRDQVLVAGLFGNERRVQWSGINDSEEWTPGTNSAGFQDFPNGGPVRGIVGGETGYVFQAEDVTRQTFVSGSNAVFQFDKVEGGRGLQASNSLVRLGQEAFYLAADGFYRFNLAGGASQPIGVAKWSKWFLRNQRGGTDRAVLGAISPRDRIVLFAFVSTENTGTTPDKVLIYDWALDEATYARVPIEAMSKWLTGAVTLDTMNQFGDLDNLPYSLDSPFWKGGTSLIGVFSADNKLSFFGGPNMQAQWITSDGEGPGRTFVRGVRPHVDSTATTVCVSSRERDGDAISYDADEAMADTGEVPAFSSGNLIRAKITVPAGSAWKFMKGVETSYREQGRR